MADYNLDVRRMLCPMPVIKTQKFVKDLQKGDRVTILSTDRGSLHDLPAWCRMYGHRVMEAHEMDGEVSIIIEIGEE